MDVTGGVHKPGVDALAERGVLEGTACGDSLFCPSEPIDRATMAVWLARVLDGGEPEAAASSVFADVDSGSPAAAFIERIAQLEVTSGCGTDPLRYCPDQPVTRGQMATFLAKAFDFEAGATAAGFGDVSSSIHESSIDALAAAGVTVGCATDPLRYCPDQPVTRGQMATFLASAHNLIRTARPAPAFKAVTASQRHACGLRTGGAITCWGENRHGKADAPPGVFKAVSAGLDHTCGVRIDGTVECWGGSAFGERDVPSGTFQAVSAGQAAGGRHICGLRTDRTVACWGRDFYGETDAPSGEFEAVSAGMVHTCGLRTDGTITCWGDTYAGKASAPRGTFKAVDASQSTSYGLRTDGTIRSWGSRSHTPGGRFRAFSIGWGGGCGVRAGVHTEGTLTCWASFDIWSVYDVWDPQNAPHGTFTAVAAGRHFACGLRTNGSITCWGRNHLGQADPPRGP